MKILKKEVDYSVRALFFIARHTRPVKAAEVYSSIKAPRPFIRKILQRLSSESILVSAKGRDGGFRLSIPLNNLTLGRLAGIFGAKIRPGVCHFGERLCPNRSSCSLKRRMAEIEDGIYAELEKTSLDDLMSDKQKT